SHRSLPRPQSPQIGPECGSNPGRACQTRAQDDVVHVAAPACGCSANPLNISSHEDRCFFLRCYRNPGIDPSRLGSRGIGIHSLRKTAINDAIRNGATMHEVREFAGHADIRTTEVYFVRKEEDAEVAARRIQIRLTGSRGQ
ncbi:MAG: hypothetical protein ACXWOV_15645, partial [Isosphaeraceae bacterium]